MKKEILILTPWTIVAQTKAFLEKLKLSDWILEQSMGVRNRVGLGLSYRPTTARLHCLTESFPWNRFLGSLESISGLLESLKIPSLGKQSVYLSALLLNNPVDSEWHSSRNEKSMKYPKRFGEFFLICYIFSSSRFQPNKTWKYCFVFKPLMDITVLKLIPQVCTA